MSGSLTSGTYRQILPFAEQKRRTQSKFKTPPPLPLSPQNSKRWQKLHRAGFCEIPSENFPELTQGGPQSANSPMVLKSSHTLPGPTKENRRGLFSFSPEPQPEILKDSRNGSIGSDVSVFLPPKRTTCCGLWKLITFSGEFIQRFQ